MRLQHMELGWTAIKSLESHGTKTWKDDKGELHLDDQAVSLRYMIDWQVIWVEYYKI